MEEGVRCVSGSGRRRGHYPWRDRVVRETGTISYTPFQCHSRRRLDGCEPGEEGGRGEMSAR